jgi:uncharacterized protein DUF4145
MKCPHCLVEYHSDPKMLPIGIEKASSTGWVVCHENCPACGKIILFIQAGNPFLSPQGWLAGITGSPMYVCLAHPRTASRPPCPREVPPVLAEEYREACLVLSDSAKASAALSRRCLQNLLREEAKVKPGNLADEIQEVIASGKLPSSLVESIDAIRNIGNFAAHPMKSEKSGEILPVEPGEAEWNLDVLESLFDFYFVQPEVIRKKREALNRKLQAAGKRPMK